MTCPTCSWRLRERFRYGPNVTLSCSRCARFFTVSARLLVS